MSMAHLVTIFRLKKPTQSKLSQANTWPGYRDFSILSTFDSHITRLSPVMSFWRTTKESGVSFFLTFGMRPNQDDFK